MRFHDTRSDDSPVAERLVHVTAEQCVDFGVPAADIKLNAPSFQQRRSPGKDQFVMLNTPPGSGKSFAIVVAPEGDNPSELLAAVATSRNRGERPECSPPRSVFLAGAERPALVTRSGKSRACSTECLVLLQAESVRAVAVFRNRTREDGPLQEASSLQGFRHILESLSFEQGTVSPHNARAAIEDALRDAATPASPQAPASPEPAPPKATDDGRIFTIISTYLEKDNWQVRRMTPPATGLITRFKGKNGVYPCMAVAVEKHQQLLFYSVCPRSAPPPLRAAVGEYLHRANYGLHVGNFEMDFGDGEIRFKSSVDAEGLDLSDTFLANLIGLNCRMIDRYQPGIVAVMEDGLSPADAIKKVEG